MKKTTKTYVMKTDSQGSSPGCSQGESQQCRDVGPSRDLRLCEGNGGGLLLVQADEEDHQDLCDEDRQPGQRDHPHRRPSLRLRLLRISFYEEIRGADPSAAGGPRVRDDPQAQGGAREAESGSESQLDINRKREAEMAKLRKLLEEVHTESEQQIHTLRTKHQTSMMELQEQIERMSRDKEKVVKEKGVMKTEISELYAQIEILQSEKVSIKKVVEKLEITVNEYNVKIEGLNKSTQDLNAQKLKLQFEAQEANKKLNDMKLAIEHAGMDKNKFATQMEELRRAADQETRNRNAAETKITSLERNIKTLMVEIEELRQVKINLEGSISKWQAENADWKKKYENEARLRVEEGDALKKKFTLEITSLTDALHNLEQKLKAAENAKAKLTSEVSVLVKDFEHSQVVIKELTAKLGSSDKTCNDLAIKLKEMTNLYEKADRDSKARAQEVVKMGNEMDRVKMANESLTQVKAKLEDELKSFKTEMDALKKRFADLDRDNRKVVHEREELARAYKKSDDEKAKALNQVQLLEKELAKLKAEFEKTFGGARSEYEANKKKLVDEINVLSRKLAEAESRLKNEVEVIKKKMSMDASNKGNAQLQNTCKVQNEKIMQLTSAYEDVNRKLGASVQQYDVTIKKLTELDVSYKKITADYNKSLTTIKDYELKLNGFNGKVNELTTANNQLEKEFGQVSKDYDDIARELKLADDRANKAGSDA